MPLPPPARQAEARATELVYQEAFLALGLKAILETLDLWQDVATTPVGAAASTARFLAQIAKVVRVRRNHTRRIGIAYYRLHRALWTGFTIQDYQSKSKAPTETLDDLRDDFYKLVEVFTPEAMTGRPKVSHMPGDDKIRVEQIKDLDKIVDRVEAALEEVATTNLASSGQSAYEKKLKAVDLDRPARVVDKERDDIKSSTGSKQAATVQKNVLDGARSTVNEIARNDKRALGFVRASKTGTPCYWCAILISRGLILYSSRRAAEQRSSDGEEFHTNCQCYAIPVYSEEQFNSSDAFDLNRRYDALWKKLGKETGLSGHKFELAWRRYFRTHQQEVSGTPGGSPNNAQEAPKNG